MRLTRAAEYGVRCVLYLCGAGKGRVVSRKELAREMAIPEQFLGKLARQLARQGILEITQGSRGGLRILHSPGEITLLEVVEAIEGEILLNDCLMYPGYCSRDRVCAVHPVWERARENLRATLREADFSTLLQKECGSAAPQGKDPA